MWCHRCHAGNERIQFRRGDLVVVKRRIQKTREDGTTYFVTVREQAYQYICPQCGEKSANHLDQSPFKIKKGTHRQSDEEQEE